MTETKPKTVRGKCPRCGKRIALLKSGLLRRHSGDIQSSTFTGRNCWGSRTKPVEGSVR